MSKLTELIEELCPDGVEYRTIEELFDTRNGYTPSRSNPDFWVEEGIPWFRMDDIRTNGNILNDSLQHISPEAVKGGKLFPAGTVIVATSATIGEHALLKVPALSNQRFTALITKPEFSDLLLPEFVHYYCFILDDWCVRNTTQSSFASVDMPKFRKFRFPVPPLEVQEEIVCVLDSFADLEQSMVAELDLRKKQFEFYRGQLFHFDHSVEWSTLGDVSLKVTSGGTPSSKNTSYYGGDIPWLRTQEIDFEDIFSTGVSITEEGLNNSSAKWIPANCVIVAMYGATAAKSAINAIPLTTNQACCNLQIDPSLAEYRFVYYWVSHMYENLKKLGEGSQSNLNAKKVKSFPIPVPPLETQREIVAKLCEFEALIQSIEQEIARRRKQYEFYRDELLTFTPKEA